MSFHSLIPPGVLGSEIEGHEDAQHQAHRDRSDQETVSGQVAGSIFGTERETSDDTSEVTEPDMHGNANSAFGGASNVVSVPGDSHRNVGVNSKVKNALVRKGRKKEQGR